jgi:hypothetical protein
MVLLLTLTACSPKPDLGDYGDTPITIAGLTDEEFTVTPLELSKLPLTSKSASGSSAKAGTVKALGVELKTFLASCGIAPEDIKLVRFIAYDEYRVTLHGQGVQNWDVILSISALSANEQPLRLLIPQAESSQWIYGVVRIEFELK